MSFRLLISGLLAVPMVLGLGAGLQARDNDPLKPPTTPASIEEATCAQLEKQKKKYIENGVAADLERGPAWARQNLTVERLGDIRMFIMLDEQLKFGCRGTNISVEEERERRIEAKKAARAAALARRRAAAAAKKKGQ